MKWFQIKKSTLWCFLLTMPFVEPQFFKTIAVVDKVYKYSVYFVIVYVIYRMIKYKKKPSLNLIIIFAMEAWILLMNYIEGGNKEAALSFTIGLIGLTSVVFIYSNRIDKLIKCLLLHLELCVYINLLTLILLPGGLYTIESSAYGSSFPGYLLGWNHIYIIWELPALFIAWIYKSMYGGKVRCYVLTVAVVFSELVFGASTGKVGIIIFVILCIIPKLKTVLTPLKGIIASVILIVLIVFARTYGFLEPIIVGLLGEDMTFTGRLFIWDNAISAIISKFFTGHGILASGDISNILGLDVATHCHSQILQILFIGGIVAFGLFVTLYVISLIKCTKFWKYKSAHICTFAIITYTIIGITEQFEYVLMYTILIIPYYLREICGVEETNKRRIQVRGKSNG